VVGVWTGNTDYEATKKATGSVIAAPLWNSIITWLHEGLPVEYFQVPQGIETVAIDGVSGKLPTKYSPNTKDEVFIQGTEPTLPDDVHIPFKICKASGKLATKYCPLDQVEEKVFDIYAPEADDWIRSQKIPQPPVDYCDIHGPAAGGLELSINSPRDQMAIRDIVPITGSARLPDMQRYWLEAGVGRDPTEWTRIGSDHINAVDRSLMELWDVRSLDGLYTLRLSAANSQGVQSVSVRVLVDNISPTVELILPYQDEIYTIGKDEWINIQALAEDNLAMQRVEFFVDDKLLGFSTVGPFSMRWVLNGSWDQVPMEGTHRIYVIAYDTAGNQTKSDEVTVRVEASQGG
jgi:hypothetical protein